MSNSPQLTANFTASSEGFVGGVNEVRQQLIELNTALEEHKRSIKQTNAEIKNYEKQLNQLKQATDNGENATADQRKEMQKLEDAIAKATTDLATHRTAQQELQNEIRSTNAQLTNMRQGIKDTSEGMKDTSTAAASFGDVLKANLASDLILDGLRELTNLLKSAAEYAYTVGSEFEAGMSQVGATMGMTAEEIRNGSAEFDMMSDKAKEMGANTKFTATEASEALNYLALAGYDAEKATTMLPKVLNLAAAGAMELALSSDMVTDSMAALDIEVEQADAFIDQMARTSQKSNTSVQQLGEAILTVGGTAKQLAGGTVELNTALGILADNGIKGSDGGTALRQVILNLAAPTEKAKQLMDELGVSVYDASGNILGLNEIFANLDLAMKGFSDEQRNNVLSTIFDARQLKSAQALLSDYGDRFDTLSEQIRNSEGAAADMADTLTDNTKGSVEIAKSALEGMGIALYEEFGKGLKDSIDIFSGAFSEITAQISDGELTEEIEGLSSTVVVLAETVAEFSVDALPDFIAMITNLITALLNLKEVIGGVVAGFAAFKTIGAVSATFSGLATSLGTLAGGATAASGALATVGTTLSAAAGPVGIIIGLLAVLTPLFLEMYEAAGLNNTEFEELIVKTDELGKEAEEYKQKAEGTDEIADEYKRIKDEVKDVNEQTELLRNLQDDLLNQYGAQAAGIDLVNGSYQTQLQLLKDLQNENSNLYRITLDTELETAKAAEKSVYTVDTGALAGTDAESVVAQWIWENTKTTHQGMSGTWEDVKYSTINHGNINFEGSYADRLADMTAIYDYLNTLPAEYMDAVLPLKSNLQKAMVDAQSGANTLVQINSEINALTAPQSYKTGSGTGDSAMQSQLAAREEAELINETLKMQKIQEQAERERTFASLKEDLEHQLKRDEITESDYYDKLEQLMYSYLVDGTAIYENTFDAIYTGRKKLTTSTTKSGSNSTADPNETAYANKKKELDFKLGMDYITEKEYYDTLRSYRDRYLSETSDKYREATLSIYEWDKKQNQAKLDSMETAYNRMLDAIDAEVEARERAKEDEDLNGRIAEVENRLRYEQLDDFSRMELEKKLGDLREEQEDLAFARHIEEQKETAKEVYEQAKAAYENSNYQLEQALTTATTLLNAVGTGISNISNTVINNNTNTPNVVMNINAQQRALDELVKAFKEAISSDI